MKTLLLRSSFWAGISLIISGLGQGIADGDWLGAAESILTGLGLIGLRIGQTIDADRRSPQIKLTMKG